MTEEQTLIAFENAPIRRHFDEATETWYFSIVDVIAVLSESVNLRDYWFRMKFRVKSDDGLELSTTCRQLKMQAPDGKMRATDCANVEGLLRLVLRRFRLLTYSIMLTCIRLTSVVYLRYRRCRIFAMQTLHNE